MLTESARLRLYMTSDLYLFLHWAGAGGGVPVHDRVRALLDHDLPRPLFRSGLATFPDLETQHNERTYVKHKHDTPYRTYEQLLV